MEDSGYSIPVLQGENVLDMYCRTMWIYLTLYLYIWDIYIYVSNESIGNMFVKAILRKIMYIYMKITTKCYLKI